MAKLKYDGVVEAAHYEPNGQLVWVRAFDRRGATFSDWVLIPRQELVKRLQEIKRNWMWPGYFIGIVAGGYRLTGHSQFLSLLKSMIKEQTQKGLDGNEGFYISLAISAIQDAGKK